MTDSHSTPETAILVAVDIAKAHNEVLIELRERRSQRRRFRVANTLEKYQRLVASCASSVRRHAGYAARSSCVPWSALQVRPRCTADRCAWRSPPSPPAVASRSGADSQTAPGSASSRIRTRSACCGSHRLW